MDIDEIESGAQYQSTGTEIARALIEAGAEIDTRRAVPGGSTALQYVCEWGKIDAVKIKIDTDEIKINADEIKTDADVMNQRVACQTLTVSVGAGNEERGAGCGFGAASPCAAQGAA